MLQFVRTHLDQILTFFFSVIVAGLTGYFVGREGLIDRINDVNQQVRTEMAAEYHTITEKLTKLSSNVQNIQKDIDIDIKPYLKKIEHNTLNILGVEKKTENIDAINRLRREMDLANVTKDEKWRDETDSDIVKLSQRVDALEQDRDSN